MNTVVFLDHDHLGHGDPELGARILKTFLQKARGLAGLDALLFVNGAVRLVAANSPVLAELALLEEQGVDLVPCGTCLQHFGITPAAGRTSSMDEIVAAMNRAEKVVSL